MGYFYIFSTILFTVYGQIIIKWQVSKAGSLPHGGMERFLFFLHLFLNPWIISAFIGGFLASLAWMAAMTKLEISYAYPFVGLTFVLVLICSAIFFHENVTIHKILGIIFIILGIIISSRSV